MKILLTGHKGYIGAVAGPILQAAGHEVVGFDTDLFAGCDFGKPAKEIPEIRKDLRDVTKADLAGFDAVLHLAALSNDPVGNLNAELTYDINHRASVKLAQAAKASRRQALCLLLVLQHVRRCRRRVSRGDRDTEPGDGLRRVQSYGGARRDAAGGRRIQPDLHAQCDRLRCFSAPAAGRGSERSCGIGV